MSQAGYTPIQLYYSTTALAVPVNTNLANGELAINITDGKLYYKDNTGTVKLLAGATAGPAGGSNTQVQFNSSGVLAGSANLTFDGTNLTVGGSATATRFIPSGSTVATNGMYLPAANSLGFSTNSTEAVRITSDGRLTTGAGVGSGSGATQLTIGGTLISASNVTRGIGLIGSAPSTSTSAVTSYYSAISTADAAFTVTELSHFSATQGTITGGSRTAPTNQYGYLAASTLTGATNNYGFYGALASGTGRYNLYMDGTADNYMAGSLGIGTTAIGGTTGYTGIRIATNLSGATSAFGLQSQGVIQSDVTTGAYMFRTAASTAASAFTLPTLVHYDAAQGTIGATSTVTNQYGFIANSSLTGATNNFGFFSNIATGTGRYNFYAQGTAANVFAGLTSLGGFIGSESLRATPVTSAVNYVDVSGQITANPPVISAQGSDTNIGLIVQTKGTTALTLQSSSTTASFGVELAANTSADRAVFIDFHASSGTDYDYRLLRASGANGNVTYVNAGTGTHAFQTNAGTSQFNISHTASAVNAFTVTGGATGNAPTLYALGSDTDISINITPKGAGALRITGSTSGYVGLKAAATAGSTTYTLPSADGSSGQFLSTNGSGTLSWATGGGGGGGTPGGSNTQVQFNNSGSFGGSANFTFNGSGITTGFVNVNASTPPTAGMYYQSTATSGLSFYNTGALGGNSAIQIYYGRSSLAATTGGIDNTPTQWFGIGSGVTPQLTIGSTASIYTFSGHAYRLDSVPYVFTLKGGSRGDNGSYTVPESNGILYIEVAADYGGNGSTGRNCIYVKNDATGFGTSTNGVKVVNNFYGRQNAFYSLQKIGDPNGGGQNFGYYAQIDTSAGANDNAAPVGLVIDNALVDNYTKTNGNAQMAIFYDRRSGSTTRTAIQFYRNTTSNSVGLITTTNSATAYTTSSDYRLKENIAPLTGAIEKVLRLKPSTYTWKIDGSVGEGFIAHELQEVIPQAVSGEKDAEKLQQVEVEHAVSEVQDADGNIVSYGKAPVYEEKMMPVYQGVDTSFLVATLTAAIQEQQALIVALTARVEALEAK
jgi:hypothetical protein